MNPQCMDAVASARKLAWPSQLLRREQATSLASHSASADVAATTDTPKLYDRRTPS